MQPNSSLPTKYNIPVPRYTSYPTVPFWKEGVDGTQWQLTFAQRLIDEQDLPSRLKNWVYIR